MMSTQNRVVVIPCSGMGKTFGSVSREAAYEVCDELRPEATRLLALGKLVLGDDEARALVRAAPVVAIDGCKLRCAAKLVDQSGGTSVREVAVLDVYRRYSELKPDGIAELNGPGRQLARVIAQEIAGMVDGLAVDPTAGKDGHA
jgi:uncharacterized metal-binding protein